MRPGPGAGRPSLHMLRLGPHLVALSTGMCGAGRNMWENGGGAGRNMWGTGAALAATRGGWGEAAELSVTPQDGPARGVRSGR